MKLRLKLKIYFVILLSFLSNQLFSQELLSINLQVHQGQAGIDLEGSKVDYFRETTNDVKYGNDISLGIGFNYFFDEKRKMSSSGAILWNYYSFQRREENSFSSILFDIRNQNYQAHSILFPMKINRQLGKLSFSLGLVPRIRIQTKITVETFTRTIFSGSSIFDYNRYQFKVGEEYPIPPSSGGIAELEHRIDLQYLIGVNYPVNGDFSIHAEFRNLVLENKLMWIEREIGNPNSGTISLGLSWRILKK